LNVAEIIAKTWSQQFNLQIDREDTAFLAGIHAWVEVNPDPTLDEDQLRNIYRIVSEVAHGDPATLAQRTTNAIARLREQRLMVRTDAAGIVRGGDYSLSRMGNAIAEWFGEREGLTRQNLEVMMTRIRADLGQIKLAAEQQGDNKHWETAVTGPLRLTVTGLIEIIDRRQQGMDAQQEETRERIASMLEENWVDAVQSCEGLLESTSNALQELHGVLMHEIEGMTSLLNEIEELCERVLQNEAIEALTHVRRQMERIVAWAASRFAAWSEYYRNVHEFIRTVISVDPERAIRSRLRDSLKEYGQPAFWYLMVAEQPPYRHLRDSSHKRPDEIVQKNWRPPIASTEETGLEPSLLERLEAKLAAGMRDSGELDLIDILAQLLPNHDVDELYVLAGDLTEWLVHHGTPDLRQEAAWKWLGKGIEIQPLTVHRKQKPVLTDAPER